MITRFKINVSFKGKENVAALRAYLNSLRPKDSKVTIWNVVKQGARNPKAKGNRAENDVSKMLSLWWSEDQNAEIFTRQDNSGSKIHTAKTSKKWVGGDIKAIGNKGLPFTQRISVEVKNVEDMELYKAAYGQGAFWSYWNQACNDADEAYKQPWLIFKQKKGQWLIALKRQLFYFLEYYFGAYRFPFSLFHNDENMCAICVLENFLEWTEDGVEDMVEASETLLRGL